jgi:conjugal transfer pilus assembly protein TraF
MRALVASYILCAGMSLAHTQALAQQAHPGQGDAQQAQRANQPAPAVRLDEEYGNAFLRYMPYTRPATPKPEEPKAPPQAAPKPPEKATKVDVEWLRKNYPLLEQRAIDDPSESNLAALAYARRIVLDKSQRLAEGLVRVTREDPLLNENSRIPQASVGAAAVTRANAKAQDAAVKELAKTGGLLVFVDSKCRFCSMQLPVLDLMRRDTGIEALVISVDGAVPAGYKGPVVRDNGMFERLRLTLTPSIVFVPQPRGFKGATDPNRYLVVSQGYYTADELTKQIAFAGYKAGALSEAVRRDLSVWDTGVASIEDLADLKLDPNDPASFRSAVGPRLLKQYGAPAIDGARGPK